MRGGARAHALAIVLLLLLLSCVRCFAGAGRWEPVPGTRNRQGESRRQPLECVYANQPLPPTLYSPPPAPLTPPGNDIENVSRSTALIHQVCLVKNKDIRKVRAAAAAAA